ncbi:hypothetical protein PAXRUDRAFT_138599 [Paxillus rubicundulus Ve08.2h10]|uniref:NUDE domain-containing protein n=1 Tax=Paxillus rubicundulus Ve08.2h10 TaxID=930991 RepID=A0A0D0DZY9_9AGAM|nr:hypothetical protein PAXRUDRAFT_138599 [Paxillus rubicundulus Ve08.2h10]
MSTAVLSVVNALHREPIMTSLDDNQINYSSTDWKAKYYEVADMLAETRAELDEFHTSSKELEEELIKEIERTEKAQQDLKVKVSRMETEKDEWKAKFMSLQTTHNTTTTSLQRELDTVRQECQRLKVQLRELEMGNDDLERNERAVTSTLADVEAKYSRVLEEKILLEHELLDKASLEEESQRLKDELRDASVEISILKGQLSASRSKPSSIHSEISTAPSALFPSHLPSTEENLLSTPPPPGLKLSELSTNKTSLSTPSRPPSTSLSSTSGQSALLQRAGFQPGKFTASNSTPPSVTRSSTLPMLSASCNYSPRTPIPRPNLVTSTSSISTTTTFSAIPMPASKSRGVQMVSEMRARVKNLEQKIHTRVPRLRMGSNAGRLGANAFACSTVASPPSNLSAPTAPKNHIQRTSTYDSKLAKPSPQRHSAEILTPKSGATTPDPNNSGWVLITDDTPSPAKDPKKERRRVSSPSAPSAYRSGIPTSASSPTFSKLVPLAQSTVNSRRPQSRLSGASQSTTATASSIHTPSSRPTTPTFLPVSTSSLHVNGTMSGIGLKRSSGPGAGTYGQPKRASLGSSTAGSPTPSFDDEYQPRERPISYNTKLNRQIAKPLPQFIASNSNVTIRGSSRIPSSTNSASVLSQSRIGRPAGVATGRRSVGLEPPCNDSDGLSEPGADKKNRGRSGSSAFGFGR